MAIRPKTRNRVQALQILNPRMRATKCTWLGEWHERPLHEGQGRLVHGHAGDGPQQGLLNLSMLRLPCLCHASCSIFGDLFEV